MTDDNSDLNHEDEQEVEAEIYFLGQNDTHRAYYAELAEQEEDEQ